MRMLRASAVLASLARLASAFSIPQSGEPMPGSSPALAGAPGPTAPAGAPRRPARCAAPSARRSRRARAPRSSPRAPPARSSPAGRSTSGRAPRSSASSARCRWWPRSRACPPRGSSAPTAASGRPSRSCISRLTFLPLIALPWLDVAPAAKLRLFIGIVAVSTVFGVIGNSAWVAWMGDLVPGRLRGRYFGQRTIFLSVAGTLASLDRRGDRSIGWRRWASPAPRSPR